MKSLLPFYLWQCDINKKNKVTKWLNKCFIISTPTCTVPLTRSKTHSQTYREARATKNSFFFGTFTCFVFHSASTSSSFHIAAVEQRRQSLLTNPLGCSVHPFMTADKVSCHRAPESNPECGRKRTRKWNRQNAPHRGRWASGFTSEMPNICS